MGMGSGAVHVNGERIYERLCRAFLVSGSQCAVPGYVHSLCKADQEGNAVWYYFIRIYGGEIPVRWREKSISVSTDRPVGYVYGCSAACGK